MSDYLWHGDGEPDAEVAELERLLAPLAYRGAPPSLPPPPRRRPVARFAGAALAVAALVALVLLWPRRPEGASWAAHVEGGVARVDGAARRGDTRVPLGAWIDSDGARVRLEVAALGVVTLEPGARARVMSAGGDGAQVVELARGALTANINAPPRRFVVQTRYVRVIDLGCAFGVRVDEAGQGRLVVDSGAVALGDGAREVEVPAGAECGLGSRGPGVPVWSDAAPALRQAAARAGDDPAALAAVLAGARPKDALTLRALAARATPETRARLDARVRELAAPSKPTPPLTPPPKPAAPKPKAKLPAAPAPPPKSVVAPRSPEPQQPVKATPPRMTHDALKELERATPP